MTTYQLKGAMAQGITSMNRTQLTFIAAVLASFMVSVLATTWALSLLAN